MFEPNLVGRIAPVTGRDVYSRATYGPAGDCPFAPVNMLIDAQKTSVRADSSASRGSADEIVAKRAKILIANYVTVEIGYKFTFQDTDYTIASLHPRRSVNGDLDHFECDLEVLPS